MNEHGCSHSGGVKVMGIAGRMDRERERMIGMSDAERAWRAQWVKDQVLCDEPIIPKDYYKERYNPIRRFYRAPLDKLESTLCPMMGAAKAELVRHIIGKFGIIFAIGYGAAYYFKYNQGDWTKKGGWKVALNRPAMYPGDKNFPYVKKLKPQEYATYGFEKSPI